MHAHSLHSSEVNLNYDLVLQAIHLLHPYRCPASFPGNTSLLHLPPVLIRHTLEAPAAKSDQRSRSFSVLTISTTTTEV